VLTLSVAHLLPGAVALAVFRMRAAILAPVIRMTLDPGALGARLVLLVSRIVVSARALPSPPAFALAGRQ